MSLDHLVLHDGDRVRFPRAQVVSVDGRTWLVAPGWYAYDPEAMPTPPNDADGVWADGVDLDRLAERDEAAGRFRGPASLSGRWSSGRLLVDGQGDPEPHPPWSRWIDPPCPPPAGGWPSGGDRLSTEIHRRVEPALVVQATVFHPRPDAPVLVLAVTEPERVEAALAPWLGGYVCVVRSRCEPHEVEAARAHLASRMREWLLDGVGVSSDDQGQPVVDVSAKRVLPELAAWARDQPPGLLRVDAWLAPDRSPPVAQGPS